jgi:hypothetical protein
MGAVRLFQDDLRTGIDSSVIDVQGSVSLGDSVKLNNEEQGDSVARKGERRHGDVEGLKENKGNGGDDQTPYDRGAIKSNEHNQSASASKPIRLD